uniref:AIG1-type G domain-containing protein n=1 Tax=Oryzias latipes TaxID=8090 RepID=A0A3P9IIJ7_ORYLA
MVLSFLLWGIRYLKMIVWVYTLPRPVKGQPSQIKLQFCVFAEPLRIMLLGKSGAGKSSSGNTILKRTAFTSDMRLKRVTAHCEKEVGMVEDRQVAIIDTPGLFEKDGNKEEIMREILMRIKLQEPAMFGPRVWDYTIVLFTHGDRLDKKTINDVISESDDNLRTFIRKCSGGFHVFNNKTPEDQTQVTPLMKKIQTLIALNGGGYYKTELYPRKERKIRERQESILAEEAASILKKEENLKTKFEGEELNMKMKVLWMKEEERARKKAEKQIRNMKVLNCFLLVTLISLLLVEKINLTFFLVNPLSLQQKDHFAVF